jgi:hypothetical protein
MQELFVPYELAVKLKEKGFNKPYNSKEIIGMYLELENPKQVELRLYNAPITEKDDERGYDYIIAPLYQQIVDWLRGKQGILITQENRSKHLVCSIWDKKARNGNGTYDNFTTTIGETPTEALNKAIEKALKLI